MREAAWPIGQHCVRSKWQLGRRASLWVSFGVALHTLWTSAAPALSYRLYIEQWHLSTIHTTAVFAIYPILVVVTLILFGGISDQIGRRHTMLAALCCSLAGSVVLVGAQGFGWLLAARAIMGVAVGLASGASTAAILEYSGDPKRAASATNVAQAIGFTMALILGGAAIQYLPWPLRTNFSILAGVIVVLIAAVWFMPTGAARGAWSPQLPHVPADVRGAFVQAALSTACAFASGAALLSLGGQISHDLVGSNNALMSGVILASFAVVSAAVTKLGHHLSSTITLSSGVFAMNSGVAFLWIAIHFHSLGALLAATSALGVGYAFLFTGALDLVNKMTARGDTARILSALYLVGYLSMGVVALSLGEIAQLLGLTAAVAATSLVLISFSMAALMFRASTAVSLSKT
jgi:MFS family permease